MYRLFGVCLLLLGGCTDPAVDDVEWACTSHDECGPGWLCHPGDENSNPTCNKAWSDQNGVHEDKLRVGISAAFSGAAEDLGIGMRTGIRACFKEVNDAGGIHGRQLELVDLDDSYEPEQAENNVEELTNGPNRGVFALIGNVGTPTAKVTIPVVQRNDTILFGPFTGAKLVRDAKRHVFSFRASYYDETAAMVRYLQEDFDVASLDALGSRIAVFAQGEAGTADDYPDHLDHQGNPTPIDAYGHDGFDGVALALGWEPSRALACDREDMCLVHWTYPRNGCMDKAKDQSKTEKCGRSVPSEYLESATEKAAAWLKRLSQEADEVVDAAIIMVPIAHPAANFIKMVRDRIAEDDDIKVNLTFLSVSFVGADALADELREAGNGSDTATLCEGVVVTQVVPHYAESSLSGVSEYRDQLDALGGQDYGFVSLEGHLAARLLVEALRKHGRDLNTGSFVQTLRSLPPIDLGLAHTLHFSGGNQAKNTEGTLNVWGTRLRADCRTYGAVTKIDPAFE